MKPVRATKHLLLGALGVVFIVACATVGRSTGPIEFGDYYAVITPDAKVSQSDCEALNRVLSKHHKIIYRIETFKNGNLVGTRGRLPEKCMREGLVAEVAEKAKTTGFTGCALQAGIKGTSSTHPKPNEPGGTSSTHPTPAPVGQTSSTHPAPGGTSSTHPCPDMGSSTARKLQEESKAMMEEIKPILEKYNKP
jgi:hypothetical protein